MENTLGFKTVTKIKFAESFVAKTLEGEDVDTTELGLVISTLVRTGNTCSEMLGMGALKGLYTWSSAGGISWLKEGPESVYSVFNGVTSWSELSSDFADTSGANPWLCQLPTRLEMSSVLGGLSGVDWYGVRVNELNAWDYDFKKTRLEEEKIEGAIMTALQLELLLKSHDYPKGRICLDCEQGRLWIWSTQEDDYLMLQSGEFIALGEEAIVIAMGESFLLT